MSMLDKMVQYQSTRISPLEMLKNSRRQAVADKTKMAQAGLAAQLDMLKIKNAQMEMAAAEQRKKFLGTLKQFNKPEGFDYRGAADWAITNEYPDIAESILGMRKTQSETVLTGNEATLKGQEIVGGAVEADIENTRADTQAKEMESILDAQRIGQGAVAAEIDADKAAAEAARSSAALKDMETVNYPREVQMREEYYKGRINAALKNMSGKVAAPSAVEQNNVPAVMENFDLGTVRSDLAGVAPDDMDGDSEDSFITDIILRAKQLQGMEPGLSWNDARNKATAEAAQRIRVEEHSVGPAGWKSYTYDPMFSSEPGMDETEDDIIEIANPVSMDEIYGDN